MIVHKLQVVGISFYVELPALMLDFLTIITFTITKITINSNKINKNTINPLLQKQIQIQT